MSWKRSLLIFPPGYAERRGQSKRVWVVLLLVFVTALLFSPELRFELRSLLDYPLHYKEYKHFGIRIPRGYQVHGIDVSRYQSRVDWERVRNMQVDGIRVSFAFIKATEGSWKEDPEFDSNWRNARRAGIIRGAYHYFLPDISPKDQAKVFTGTVRLLSGDLPPVVDVEETRGMNKAQIQRYTKEFLILLEKRYKVRPILYTNKDFYKRFFAENEAFRDYRFWIAHYHVADFDMPGDQEWHFWQHSDRGNVNGINEPVDFNVFNGDSAALRSICIP
ncbi:MAG: glycoside hydrolase family 25 protein [Saprospiraceae bacterium]|nr:glycoside hydrolase family 25 protein [Saprospiraceae bacterium]MCB9354808.1 glycoside hydrolase family 25 protein [Lewinellaceae bacterium]